MMNDPRNVRENDLPVEHAERSRLAERPERRNGRRVGALLFVLCGCLIILGGGGVLAWQLSSHANAPAVSTSTPASSNSAAKQAVGFTGAREPVDVIMQQEVQALRYANNRWLSMGCIAQQDVQDNLQRDTGTAAYMDAEFTDWFRG